MRQEFMHICSLKLESLHMGLTGRSWAVTFYPLHGFNSETFSLLPLHRHLLPLLTVLSLSRAQGAPIGDLEF